MNGIPNYTKDDIMELPQTMRCEVTELSIKKAKHIFVDRTGTIKTDKPEEDFIMVRVQSKENEFNKEYHMKKYDSNRVPDNSNLGKYLKRYGLLGTGQEVVVVRNAEGYYDLVL